MNKLTKKTTKGVGLVMADSYADAEEQKADVKVRIRKAIEKLYLYETLELEPEEIYDLLQLTATIRSRLNSVVTWASPYKDQECISKLLYVKIGRDIKTGKIRVSAELQHGQNSVVVADIKHIKELKEIKFE